MVEVAVRPVAPGDIEELAAHMRQADREEIAAAGAPGARRALEMSVSCSTECWAADIDGQLACLFGVSPISMTTGVGAPWMLGTDQITRHPGVFIRRAGPYIRSMLQAYPHLFNFVDARNAKAVRWLKRAGFTVHEPAPYGPYSMLFHPFEMKA